MFDPTIFDNLKVVFEGALYDLDHDGRVLVSGREDIVDIAQMSRTFRLQVRKPDSEIYATLVLTSGLLDFAGELRRIHLADQLPGCELAIQFQLPVSHVQQASAIDRHFQTVWGEVAEVRQEVITVLVPDVSEDADPIVSANMNSRLDRYRIGLEFRAKIDEDNITDVESLLQHLVATMEFLDEVQ